MRFVKIKNRRCASIKRRGWVVPIGNIHENINVPIHIIGKTSNYVYGMNFFYSFATIIN